MVSATISTDAGVASGLDFALVLADAQTHAVTVNAGTAVETTWSGVEQVQLTLGSGNDLVNTQGVASNAAETGQSIMVDGGAGNDTFAGDALAIGQTVFAGGAGTDLLVMDWTPATAAVTFDGIATYGFYVPSYGTSQITATEVERWKLTGSAFGDALFGGALQDSLSGGAGADTLTGGAGNDILNGGADDDLLFGGSGDNRLTGGLGADHFAFAGTDRGIATIVDFNALNGGTGAGDVLEFRGLLVGSFAYRGGKTFTGGSDNTEARVVGDHLLVDANGDGVADLTIVLTGLTSANQLSAADFLFA
jgi:Ca2+-binding RTX toxin-like protein